MLLTLLCSEILEVFKMNSFIAWLKSLTSEKKTFSAIFKLLVTSISVISSFFSFSVLLNDWLELSVAEEFCKTYWWILIIFSVFLSFVINREKLNCSGILKNKDLRIDVKVSNLFSWYNNANSYVIPTNTFFRTIMKDEYISAKSVQGAFQLKFFKNNINELDQLIEKSLRLQGIIGEECADLYGQVKKYPVGTVAKVDLKGKHYYFVAINDVNQFGKPINQSIENVDVALKGLFHSISEFGYCDVLAMPLIGTGRAAIPEATIERVFKMTTDLYVFSQEIIARKLIICLSPKDYIEGRLDFLFIKKFIDYRCLFN